MNKWESIGISPQTIYEIHFRTTDGIYYFRASDVRKIIQKYKVTTIIPHTYVDLQKILSFFAYIGE